MKAAEGVDDEVPRRVINDLLRWRILPLRKYGISKAYICWWRNMAIEENHNYNGRMRQKNYQYLCEIELKGWRALLATTGVLFPRTVNQLSPVSLLVIWYFPCVASCCSIARRNGWKRLEAHRRLPYNFSWHKGVTEELATYRRRAAMVL